MVTSTRSHAKAPAPAAITFTLTHPAVKHLFDLTRELADLGKVAGLLSWDQQTQMALAANVVRGPQQAAMAKVLHEKQTARPLVTAVAKAEAALAAAPADFTPADHALARRARRMVDRAARLPTKFITDFAEATAEAFGVWMRAKADKQFAPFAAPLARLVDLSRRRAAYLDPQADPYAVLFDLFEPHMPLADCSAALERLRAVTVPLLKRIQAATPIDGAVLHGEYPEDQQLAISRTMLQVIGYRFENGRLDLAPHPFMSSMGSPYDVRVTTRLDRQNVIRALLPAMHEGGHALYEQGIDPALSRTILGGGVSLGIHESQSRGWENLVGRAEPFWQAHYAKLQAVFPKPFKTLPVAEFVRALNRVAPGFIRVEADELTYNLHIIIRFELEQALIGGHLEVKDLPAAWNQKYHDYLGITPPDDALGVLQDIHWSHGSFGYFSTYSLGNLYAAQFMATARRAFPDMDARLAKGETSFLREWQREQIHRWGSIDEPTDLSRRVTGEPLNPEHFVAYVTAKFERLYGLKSGRK